MSRKLRISATVHWEMEVDENEESLAKAASVLEGAGISYSQLKVKESRRLVRIGEFKPEQVLPYIGQDVRRDYIVDDKTYSVRLDSQRYFVFRDSLKCAACELEGSVMLLEQNPSDKHPHFNLYARQDDKLVLMTKDHIRPKSDAGDNCHSNYQTMDIVCNNLKGNVAIKLDDLRELRRIYDSNRCKISKKALSILLDESRGRMVGKAPARLNKKELNLYLAADKTSGKYVTAAQDINV